jgi:hypothetical protein
VLRAHVVQEVFKELLVLKAQQGLEPKEPLELRVFRDDKELLELKEQLGLELKVFKD